MAEIGGLVVDEKNRDKGIGRVLLTAAGCRSRFSSVK